MGRRLSGVGKHGTGERPRDRDRSTPGQRRQVPPDDRLTTILPPVVDDRSPRRPDPIDEVKAALDGLRRRPCSATRSRRSRPRWTVGRDAAPRPAEPGRPPTGRTTAAPPDRGDGPTAQRRLRTAGRTAQLDPADQLAVGAASGLPVGGGAGAVADRHVRHGVLHRRHSQAGRHPHQPGLDHPGQRRLGDRQNHSARRQSGRCQHQPSAGARAPGGDRRRGPQLLFQPGLRLQRLRAGGEQQPVRQRRPAGRVDDHPAIREERAGRFRPTRGRAV